MTTEQDPQVEVSEETDGNAELRAAYKRSQDALKEANGLLLERNLNDVGLDPNAGLGKAIAKEYDGEMTVEALATYARDEYGHDAAIQPEVPEAVQAGDRLDQAMQTSTPVEPVPPVEGGDEQVARIDSNDPEATREDSVASIRRKSEQFQETFYQ